MYATVAELTAAWGEDLVLRVSDRDGDGAADAGVLEAALAEASNHADSYLANRYPTPLTDPAHVAVVRRPVIDIAVYNLATTHGLLTDTIRERRDQAERFLRRLSSGEARLGGGEEAPDGPPSRTAEVAGPTERRWGRGAFGIA